MDKYLTCSSASVFTGDKTTKAKFVFIVSSDEDDTMDSTSSSAESQVKFTV